MNRIGAKVQLRPTFRTGPFVSETKMFVWGLNGLQQWACS